MFCTKCGFQNDNTSRFCVGCGSPLEAAPVPPAPPKKKSKTLLLLIAAAATVLLITILLIVIFSGSSPESVVEDYLEAEFNGDQITMSELRGFDPWDSYMASMYDLDAAMDSVWNDLIWYEREGELDLDFDDWYAWLNRIDDERDFYRFWLEYSKAEAEALVDAHDASYEILTVHVYELHGTEMRDARKDVKSSYDYWESWGYAPIYNPKEIEAYYEVNVTALVEYDDDAEVNEQTMLVILYRGDYYIAHTYWYGS